MKIGIMFVGLCRPTTEDCISNIRLLKDSFKDYDCDTYLTDYNSDSSRELSKYVDNLILIKRESDEFIKNLFPNVECINAKNDLCSQVNIWRLRRKIRNTLSYIESTGIKYDFLVYSRPCLCIKVDTKKVLNKGWYTAPNLGDDYIDDRFGVAEPHIMKSVWWYSQEHELANIRRYKNNEAFTKSICFDNDIKMNSFRAEIFLPRKEDVGQDRS